MALNRPDLRILEKAIELLDGGFGRLSEVSATCDEDALSEVLQATARRLQDNYPYHHPLYVGQMLKPPHPVAWLTYALAMLLNPNNHASEGGRASSRMEKEAVAAIARMFDWDVHLGHLSSGGTIANFEALWVAREMGPGGTIAASTQAHYTHARLANVLGVPYCPVDVDGQGRMDVGALERVLASGNVGTVVATMGTTAAGAVDPLDKILSLRAKYDFRLHADAAYGGYYRLVDDLTKPTRRALESISHADSIVVDPHKHGLQPYGCGCVLFRDPAVASVYHHDAPYTYFTSDEMHLGQIALECSRSGAAAVALWATMQLLPLEPGGRFARDLNDCRTAAVKFYHRLLGDSRFVPLAEPDLDIVTWAVRAASASEASRLAESVFHAAAKLDLHLALSKFPGPMLSSAAPVANWDSDSVTCLRACVMKPEHDQWLPEIWQRLSSAADVALHGKE